MIGMLWTILAIAFAFWIGCLVGTHVERAGYSLSENRETLVYEGSVYVRVVEGTTLESYLTAAGRPKPKGEKKEAAK